MCRRTGVLVSVGVKNNGGLRCVPRQSHLKQNVCDVWRFPEHPVILRLLQSVSSHCFFARDRFIVYQSPVLCLHVHGGSMHKKRL